MSTESEKNDTKFVFFGTDDFSLVILEELKNAGFIPALVVTAPDRPKGRGLKLSPPPVKVWGDSMGITTLQPKKIDEQSIHILRSENYDLFIVASYGKILPQWLLTIPQKGVLNVHPSLLPLYRGASPIQTQIIENEKNIGTTIMLMDEEMDHGPVLAQQELGFTIQDLRFMNLRNELAKLGGKLLAETIPKWIRGEIKPKEQDHKKATYTKKITKEDGLIDINDTAEKKYRKFLAYHPWPGTYFFENGVRIKITDAELRPNLEFKIKKVIPEGKQEIDYEIFCQKKEC